VSVQPAMSALAGEVSAALRRKGVEAILVGGAVVTIYSRNEYESLDLDFVVRGTDRGVAEGMQSIGFMRGTGRHFERRGTKCIVEFLSPPPAVGGLLVHSFAHLRTAHGTLLLYEPTHCVMDRLAAFYHWSDRQSLDQAVMVARRHRIRMQEIEAWSAGEGHPERFREFRDALATARRRRKR